MKKYLIFFGGLLTGIIVTFLFFYIIKLSDNSKEELPGLTMFSEVGECIQSENVIEVFQVIRPNVALARTGDWGDGIPVLLINYDGKTYYDDQKVEVPANKCARQVGTYQYQTNNGMLKTVPAVIIE